MIKREEPTASDKAWFVSKFVLIFGLDLVMLFTSAAMGVGLGGAAVALKFPLLAAPAAILSFWTFRIGSRSITTDLIKTFLLPDAVKYGFDKQE